MQSVRRADSFAELSAGSSIPARIAMIATTISSSINVKYNLDLPNKDVPATVLIS